MDPDKVQIGGGHYKDMAIQPMEYAIRNRLGHAESTVVKYVSRHEKKGKAEDLRKAIHVLLILLKHRYGEEYDGIN